MWIVYDILADAQTHECKGMCLGIMFELRFGSWLSLQHLFMPAHISRTEGYGEGQGSGEI